MSFAPRWTPPPRQRDCEPPPLPARPPRRGVLARIVDTVVAVPKPKAYRDKTLLDMAEGRPCLLLVAAGCQSAQGKTTVACHGNRLTYSKGMGRKADDCYSVWGCAACHHWLDRSGAPARDKEAAFEAAMKRQIAAWRQVANDLSEPPATRRAALHALDALGPKVIAGRAA